MAEENVLKPINMGVKNDAPKGNATDEFGQQYDADGDKSKWSGQSPADSRRYHSRADTDLGPRSLHHTLGVKHNQASPGDHDHGTGSAKNIGPLEMDPLTPGSKRAQWTIPTSATVADVVALLQKFVNFRQV